MKYPAKFFLAASAVLFFFSCSQTEQPKGFIKYEMRRFEKALGDTSAKSTGYAKIKLVYPEIKEAVNTGILDALNSYVKNQILTAIFEEGRYKQPEFLVNAFIKEYDDYVKDATEASRIWTLERKVDVVFITDRIACFRFFETSFLGGAHPNSNYFFTVYDLATGGKLKAKDVFVEEYKEKLTAIAEKKFREIRGLKGNDSLNSAGFQFPGGKFALNDNFGFLKEGIVFFYNPYEIAPYAAGETNLIIPYNEVKDLILPAFLPPAQK